MKDRFKRIVAFVIDWNVSLLLLVLIAFLTSTIMSSIETVDGPMTALVVLLFFFLFFASLAVFILRDVIFKGKSIGKRLLGLCVYDNKTLQKANAKQRFLRNIFLCAYLIDAVILLATGETIGDRVAGTVVVSEKSLDDYRNNKIDESVSYVYHPEHAKKKSYKKAIIIVAIVLCCMIAFVGLVQVLLNSQKGTEQYKIAYNYLVSSETFKSLNVDESKIRMNSWSSHTYFTEDEEGSTASVEIGFKVEHKYFTVVCHQKDGVWQICNDCTSF